MDATNETMYNVIWESKDPFGENPFDSHAYVFSTVERAQAWIDAQSYLWGDDWHVKDLTDAMRESGCLYYATYKDDPEVGSVRIMTGRLDRVAYTRCAS